jgi:hypothetical protein
MLHTIHYKDNAFYCINLTDVISSEPKPETKINHIVVIDNATINNKTHLNEIKCSYPQMLIQYGKIASFEYVTLITTWPKIKCMQISSDQVYEEFSKIIFNNNIIKSAQMQLEMLNECIHNIIPDLVNEIVIFTSFISRANTNLLNVLADHTLALITNTILDSGSCVPYTLHTAEEYSNFINSRVFCHIQPNTKNKKIINTKNASIFGTNTNEISFMDMYNFIPITEKIDSCLINNVEHNLVFVDTIINDSNILDMIECVLYNNLNINESIGVFKTFLLFFNNSNNEFKNRAMILYYKYKTLYSKYISLTIESYNVANDDNVSTIIEYGKKSPIPNSKIFTIPKFNQVNLEKFLTSHDTNTTAEFNTSLDFFESPITLSNWHDEIKNNCCMGILFTFTSSELTKKGVHGFGTVNSITQTFMPVIDFISNANEFFETRNADYGNLNNSQIVDDDFIGTANAILPIYIHKQHWEVGKIYLKPLLGLIHSHSPFSYVKAYENIYCTVFTYMTKLLFDQDKKYLNNKFIQIYFCVLRTCAEICFENKYNFGIKNLITSYMAEPVNRMSKSYLDYDKLFTQILTTGYNIVDIQTFLVYLLEEDIRLCVRRKQYTGEYIKSIQNIDNYDDEFEKLITHISSSMQNTLEIFIAFYKINTIFRDIINKCGTYGQFIKKFDKNYNVLDEDSTKHVVESIISTNTNNDITFEEFYNIIGLPYNKNKITMYILQGINCRNNKLMIEIINFNKYIDIINTDIDSQYAINYVKSQ